MWAGAVNIHADGGALFMIIHFNCFNSAAGAYRLTQSDTSVISFPHFLQHLRGVIGFCEALVTVSTSSVTDASAAATPSSTCNVSSSSRRSFLSIWPWERMSRRLLATSSICAQVSGDLGGRWDITSFTPSRMYPPGWTECVLHPGATPRARAEKYSSPHQRTRAARRKRPGSRPWSEVSMVTWDIAPVPGRGSLNFFIHCEMDWLKAWISSREGTVSWLGRCMYMQWYCFSVRIYGWLSQNFVIRSSESRGAQSWQVFSLQVRCCSSVWSGWSLQRKNRLEPHSSARRDLDSRPRANRALAKGDLGCHMDCVSDSRASMISSCEGSGARQGCTESREGSLIKGRAGVIDVRGVLHAVCIHFS